MWCTNVPSMAFSLLVSVLSGRCPPGVKRAIAFFPLIVFLSAFSTGCNQPQTQTGPPEKITIAYSTLPHTTVFHIAFLKGFLSAEGLEVKANPFPFGKLALDALLEGKADMATQADTPVMFAITGGKKIYIIAQIASSSRSEAIVARKDRGIATPYDLKGKKIGVSLGTANDFFMDSFLTTHGISRNEVKIVNMTLGEMADAIIKGRVDAVSTWVPFIQQVENRLGNKGITFYDEAIFHEPLCLTASQEFVKHHPEAVKKVLRALVRAEKFINENPEESRRLVSEFIKMDRTSVDQIFNLFDYKVILDQTLLVSLEDQAKWAIKNKLTRARTIPNFIDFIYTDALKSVKSDAVRLIR